MNAKQLISYFDRMSGAVDARVRVRSFILEAAVRGGFSNEPYPIESLSDSAKLQNGYAFKSEWFASSGVRLVRNANVGHGVINWHDTVRLPEHRFAEFARFELNEGDVVLSLDRPFIATGTKVARLRREDVPSLLLQRVGRFQIDFQALTTEFLYLWLRSPLFARQILPGRSNGVPHISSKQVEGAEIPLPPLEEQLRVVAKVDELMALCDELEKAQQTREQRRDRLAVSSQRRMVEATADPETFRTSAGFYLERLPCLATRPEHITELRRTILDLAVRGNLVRQDPKDEPATQLLDRVKEEKKRLVSSGEMKEQKPLPAAREEELGFELPSGWEPTRLGLITACLDYKREPVNITERKLRTEGKDPAALIPYYGATQQQGWIDAYLFDEELLLLGEDGVPFFDAFRRKSYVISGKSWVNNHAHVFRGILVEHTFVAHWLNTFDYKGRVAGATRSKLNQKQALDIPVPVAPLGEQKRILAKVDELMSVCDALEGHLREGSSKRSRLLEAVLHEALHSVA